LFPLRDENPTVLFPVITMLLIIANVAVWVYFQGAGLNQSILAGSVCRWGAIPGEIMGSVRAYDAVRLAPGVPACEFGGITTGALFTSMFLHGGWMHLIGNMWFLWLFGNNVEDSMGHLRFLVFYIVVGLLAGLAHVLSAVDSPVPTVGASGAISGVMGAYLLLYPRVRIRTLFIFIIFFRIIPIPAWAVLIYWFAIQVLSGWATPVGGGGVAFWAHIGGFIAGVVLVKFFENPVLVDARRRHLRLRAADVGGRGWL
jgi:membrane associated rhomboid family serine protease